MGARLFRDGRWGRGGLIVAVALLGARPLLAVPIPYRVGPAESEDEPTKSHFQWEVKDQGAELALDFGADDPELPRQLGISRLVKLPARRQGDHFIVQGNELNALVREVFTPVAKDKQLVRRDTEVTQVDLQEVSIQVARDNFNLRLTLTLDVTVHTKDEDGNEDSTRINGSFPITAEPVPLKSEDASKAVLDRFGRYVDTARKRSIDPRNAARYVDEEAFRRALSRAGEDAASNADTHGFVDRRGTPVAYIRPGALPYTTVHEVTHVYMNPHFRDLGKYVNEGVTHFFAQLAVVDPDGNAAYDFSQRYQQPVRAAEGLLGWAGLDTVATAYFGSGTAEIEALRRRVDENKGPGWFDRFIRENR